MHKLFRGSGGPASKPLHSHCPIDKGNEVISSLKPAEKRLIRRWDETFDRGSRMCENSRVSGA